MDEKLEDPVDPVQAMLQHMIPHLESKPTRSVDTLLKDDKPEADTNPSPKKKKKVSYKDIAVMVTGTPVKSIVLKGWFGLWIMLSGNYSSWTHLESRAKRACFLSK
ncbi:hypothetical protein T459_31605 [Capsicum annuum]|uniref:Uncharacterized protein n=1 Tax=Capsicum annuum TaxID=4072 RepID=A0A2G2Y450_CAPAN|nr:hypothetical protein T459_31605 [Capsicum annuum]